ncbi:MAG: SDR family oxidoreductase [Ktedonobacteraceae bacterium]|nr:SDR family oxidoreductase [Ktedonobacteraceae bacterium]
MHDAHKHVALITGGSRGIGAETALALARRGYDIAIAYRNKAARAAEVAAMIEQQSVAALAIAGDITHQQERYHLFAELKQWRGHLDLLILNASGGIERDLLAANPDYPMHINRDAQLALLDGALPLMPQGSTVLFVTSHWAHLYGRVEQIPTYEPVAASKHAGEVAMRARQRDLELQGVRLLVVTGDLIEGTITPKLLERASPGLAQQRRGSIGQLPTAAEMGEKIAASACDPTLPAGHTVVIGGTLESMLKQ